MQVSTSKLCEKYSSSGLSKEMLGMKRQIVEQFVPPKKEDFSAISNYSDYSNARVTKAGTAFVQKREGVSGKKESSRLLGQERSAATVDGAVQTAKETTSVGVQSQPPVPRLDTQHLSRAESQASLPSKQAAPQQSLQGPNFHPPQPRAKAPVFPSRFQNHNQRTQLQAHQAQQHRTFHHFEAPPAQNTSGTKVRYNPTFHTPSFQERYMQR